MAAVLSSPTPSLPTSSVPIVTPPLLGSPDLPPEDAAPPSVSSSPSSASASEPSTPTGHHGSLVPAYPYNVAMVPSAVNGGPLPDDSELTTRLPSICVDYLSHDWAEDDVWTSWKAMTRHKAEIANGVRLENASWRTWAKQRGNLKTVSPETLNWLKDSDVTWLYGPLHTAVEAVPPPKEATASERLGLEPLRSLSESKANEEKKKGDKSPKRKEAVASPRPPQATLQQRRNSTREVKTKPILKYRSLSDILMPQGQPTSPVIEQLGMDFEDQATISVHHARSDSHLVRLNSLNRKSRSSPLHSPGSSSPERTASDSSSATSQFLRKSSQRRNNKRHISFNHRVEQCIAIDSADERPYSTAASSDEEDDDDVLTFGARSPRHNSFARQPPKPEPHTIARLGPTTLKSVELYPAPSPAVVFQADPTEYDDGSSSPSETSFAQQHVEQYDAGQDEQLRRQQQQAGQRVMYDYSNASSSGGGGGVGGRAQWDPEDDEDYAMGGFDYFGSVAGGPDAGMGDEYDMAQYGSTHLVGGSHNNYRGGSVSDSSSYLGGGPYSPTSPYNPNTDALDPSYHASTAIPHYRDQQQHQSSSSSSATVTASPVSSPSVASAGVRGPYSPSASSRDSGAPKRSALKGGRSRESSVESTPVSSAAPSPSLSASTSPPTGIQAVATAIPAHVRPPGVRRTNSSEDGSGFQERGRSASRGSSSSLEREASANRRSSSSISPTSSYSPPTASGSSFSIGASGTYGSPSAAGSSSAAAAGGAGGAGAVGAKPIAIQPRGMGTGGSGSYDSLSSVMNASNGRGAGVGAYLPGVPESGESPTGSDTATIRIPGGGNGGNSGAGGAQSTSTLGRIVTSSSVDSMGSLGSFGAGQTPTSPTMSQGLPSPARSRFSIGSALDEDDDAMVEDVGSAFPPPAGQDASPSSASPAGTPKASPPATPAASASAPVPAPAPAPPSSTLQSSLGHSRTPSLPRLRNASPSTGVASEDGHGSPAEPALATTAAVPSPPIATSASASSPSAASPPPLGGGGAGAGADDDLALKRTSSASSYARRSLLRASGRAASDGSTSSSRERERELYGDHDYHVSSEDDLVGGGGAGVGRGLDMAGTARDFLGAISKGIWGSLGSGGSASGGGGSGSGSDGRRSSSSGGR
ncbi:hypothetical protein JCM6882_006310 [Rhodosporidiobolus microsporus]